MNVPPMTSCVDFLWRTAGAVMRAKSGMNAEPGSVFSTEIALDDEVTPGDEWVIPGVPGPYNFAQTIAGALLWAAGERVATLGLCADRHPPHLFSVAELARAATEAAALSMWLGDDEVTASERLQRLLGLMAAENDEIRGLRRLLGVDESTPGLEEAVLAWGQQQGIRQERPPTWTVLVHRADPQHGRAVYKRLSAGAHTRVGFLLRTWMAVVELQETANPAPAQLQTWSMSLTGAYYTLLACQRRWRLKGQDHNEEVAELLSELAVWEDALRRASPGL